MVRLPADAWAWNSRSAGSLAPPLSPPEDPPGSDGLCRNTECRMFVTDWSTLALQTLHTI
jgi:hypothetical protein